MSYNFQLVAIKGEHPSEIAGWLTAAGYSMEPADSEDPTHRHLEIHTADEWTLLESDCGVLDESDLALIARESKSRVIELTCGGNGEAYSLVAYLPSGEIDRVIAVVEGELVEEVGEPLPIENGMALDATLAEGEMLKLAERLGHDMDGGRPAKIYTIRHMFPDEPIASEGYLETCRRQQRIGRWLSTILSVTVALFLFLTMPHTESISRPLEFVLTYGLASLLVTLLLGVSTFLLSFQKSTPVNLQGILAEGILFQLRFVFLFFFILLVCKVTGYL